MKQIRPFADERIMCSCVYCGQEPCTRDHIPPRVLLNSPYPENLPVVPSCKECNEAASMDEEYFACLIQSAQESSVNVREEKVRRILDKKPALQTTIKQFSYETYGGNTVIVGDNKRLDRIFLKLAKGHAAYELHTPVYRKYPESKNVFLLHNLSASFRRTFESPIHLSLLPEIGSRAMQRIEFYPWGSWIEVQNKRYRYLAAVTDDSIIVRIVISEYIGCEISWEINDSL